MLMSPAIECKSNSKSFLELICNKFFILVYSMIVLIVNINLKFSKSYPFFFLLINKYHCET